MSRLKWVTLACYVMWACEIQAQEYPQQYLDYPSQHNPALPSSSDVQDILALIENQLNAVTTKQYEIAYNSYTAPQFRELTSFEEFKYFVTGYPVFTKNKNAIFGNIDFRRHYASVVGTLTSLDGQSRRVEYFLVKAGGLWKVAGIQLVRTAELAPNPVPAAPYEYFKQREKNQ